MKSKRLTCAYLYADGHAILLYEKTDPDAGTVEYAELHERWTDAQLDFKGRLVFGRYESAGFLRLAKMSRYIRAKAPSIDKGSDNTRRLGIAVGFLEFCFSADRHNGDCAHFASLDCISCGFTYQPDTDDKFDANICHWGITRVGKVHRVKQPTANTVTE